MMPALPSVANEGASLVSKKMDWTKSTWILVILLVLQPWATHGYRQRLNNAGLVNPRQPQLQQQRPTPPIPNPNPGIVGFLGGPDPDPMRQLMYHTYRRFLALRLFKQGRGQFFVQRSGQIVLNEIPCIGGCAPPSYCDKGICRCPREMMAVHGACWKLHEGVIEDAANFELRKERQYINPYKKSCSSHRHCHGVDINLFCRRDTMKCACRDALRWNLPERECQLFVPVSCPRIVNGTLMEVSEEEEMREEEEKEDIEEIPQQVNRYGNDQVNRYNRYNDQTVNRIAPGGNRYNQRFQDNLNRDLEKVRHGQQPEVRRQPFEEDKNDEEEEAEEDETADMLIKINPYAATVEQIEEAFCFDMTVLLRNYTETLESRHHFFAPFGSTPAVVAIFVIFTIVITGVCFYAFSHTAKTQHFFRNTFKSPKRVDTPEEFKDIDDSDDDDNKPSVPASGRPRQDRLFSTPQHNPHNPFNSTSQSPNRRGRN